MLDLAFTRAQFPAFSEPSLNNSAFFENAGGSYMCRQVIEHLNSYYVKNKVQPYHPYPQAQAAGLSMDNSYPALANWLNVKAEEIYFGPSTSQNTNVLANAMLDWLQVGDEIIVTNQDHEANSGAWRRLSDHGIKIIQWDVDAETGSLQIEKLASLFSASTKVLAFTHCSNILGEINPVEKVCKLAKQNNVITVVDGVSFCGHGLPDIEKLAADIYLFSFYKVYGPHQGVMVVRSQAAELLSNQGHFFNSELREKRLTPAGPDHAQVAASIGVCDYFETLYQHHNQNVEIASIQEKAKFIRELLATAELKVLEPIIDFFNSRSDIRIIGPSSAENRAPTISIVVDDQLSMSLAQQLGEQGIMCGAGHFYSVRLLEAMNIDLEQGVLRFSLVHYTSPQEVQKLITSLKTILDK